jgi:RimJ/RimL family protein N-acetyltransferase
MSIPVLETTRLRLRVPEERDFEGFKALMSDEIASRHIGGVQNEFATWRALASVIGHWQMRGYGFFTVEERETGQWVGRIGPWYPHGWSQPEIGWSILREHWGKGYAPEAAAACMDFAFDRLGWEEVIHLIAAENVNSQGVAKKLGSYDTGRDEVVAGFGMMTDVWGQSKAEWTENRKRFA